MNISDLELKRSILEQALVKNPSNPGIHLDLSNVYLALEDISQAKQHLYQALRLNPNYAEAYNNLGRLLYKQMLFQDALPYFEKALRLRPDYFEAHYNLANSFSNLNQFDRALFHYERAVSLQPHHQNAHHNLGLILFEAQRYQDAEVHLKKVWDESSQVSTGLILGQVYLALGKLEDAKKLYESLISIDETLTEAHHNLGIIFLWAHENANALTQFDTVLKYDPSNETARHMANALRGVTPKEPTSNKYVADLFDQYADHYDVHVKEKLNYQVPFLLRNALGGCLKEKLKSGRILDLGCGTGLSGIYFRDLATDLIGLDVSPKMIEKATALNAYDELHTTDILQYLSNTTTNPFNLIIACDVLVYFGDLSTLFKEVARHLVWGGHFIFTIEINEPNELNEMKEQQDYFLQTTGRFAHSRDYIVQLSGINNFHIIHEAKIVLRKNASVDIQGLLFILERN